MQLKKVGFTRDFTGIDTEVLTAWFPVCGSAKGKAKLMLLAECKKVSGLSGKEA